MIPTALFLLFVVVKTQEGNVLGRPEKPLLSPDRQNKVYASGERVIFTCTPPQRQELINSFLLYKGEQSVSVEPTYTSERYHATFRITDSTPLKSRPEKPLLSPDRKNKVYVSGERVGIICTPPQRRESISSFLLYKGVQRVSVEPTYPSERDSATFWITEPSAGSKSYTCSYTFNVNGTIVESDRSTIVQIQIVGVPEKPALSPGRTDKVYVSDELVTFTCSSPQCRYSICNFLLYKDMKLVSSQTKYANGGDSVGFAIRERLAGSKSYTCSYTWIVSDRIIKSYESTALQINVVGRPEKALLSPDRRDKVYMSGEWITFACTAPQRQESISSIFLYKDKKRASKQPTYTSGRYIATFTFWEIWIGSKSYTCSYTCNVLGRTLESHKSTAVWIELVAWPPKPRISCDRSDKVYASDESVIFTCRTTGRVHSGGIFQLYNGQQLVNEELSQPDSATFTIANRGDAPNHYYCVYTYTVFGRSISSEESDSIKITIVDLTKPIISLVSSHVSQAEDVTFNCTSTKSTSVGTFYLYKNGVRLNDSVPQRPDAQEKSVTFTIRNVDPGNSGNYSCGYQLLEGNRELMSAPSDAVLLSVSAKSIQPWIPALAVVALVLMFGVLGVYCWKKGKSRSRGEVRATPPPKDGPNNNDNVVRKTRDRAEFRAAPAAEHSPSDNDNIVYADLKLTPRKKKQKGNFKIQGKKECFETDADDNTVYADVKL